MNKALSFLLNALTIIIVNAFVFSPSAAQCQSCDRLVYIQHGMGVNDRGGSPSKVQLITPDEIKTVSTIPPHQNNGTTRDRVPIEKADWLKICESLDLNYFFGLPSSIGSAGRADGSYEWVEISTTGKKHRVIFDRNTDALDSIVDKLPPLKLDNSE